MYSSLCFWPLAHLQSENKKPLILPVYIQLSMVQYIHWRWDVPDTQWQILVSTYSCISPMKRDMCVFLKVVLPLPKCLQTKASPRIIWPHRSIHPQPVSDVGPVPPVTWSTIRHESLSFNLKIWVIQMSNLIKCRWGVWLTNISSLTNWQEVFSVCEP